MYEILPGILEQDWAKIEHKIELVRPFAKVIHIDLLDGKLAPNTTFADPTPFVKYADDFFLELHMMVIEPIDYIETWAQAGFRRFLGHVEKMSDQQAFIQKAKQYGEAGLALDGPTDLSAIKVSYDFIDAILVYTSGRIGFSGPPFDPSRLEKIQAIHSKTGIPISVDGGIRKETITDVLHAGATRFTATSAIFQSENPQEAYKQLLSICEQVTA